MRNKLVHCFKGGEGISFQCELGMRGKKKELGFFGKRRWGEKKTEERAQKREMFGENSICSHPPPHSHRADAVLS